MPIDGARRARRPRVVLAILAVALASSATLFACGDGKPGTSSAPTPKAGPRPGVATFSQILIGYATPTTKDVFKRSKDEAKALADKLLARLKGGDRMDVLIHDFTDDRAEDGTVYNSGSYTIALGHTRERPVVRDAVFSLKPGAFHPEPLDTGVAFLVIRRDD